jgi:mitochondrial FAD-linked sulfhydryl oxidase
MISSLAAGTAAVTGSRPRDDCPPDVDKLGRHTWTFLHTTAAYYPTNPSPVQRSSMLSLLHSLPTLYPCSHCADELGSQIKRHPPDVSGGPVLRRWMCDIHNEVNRRLGKAVFDCDRVDERWKDGWKDGSCD